MSCIIGIDNGVTGAICVLSTVHGAPPVALIPMPVRRSTLMHREVSLSRAKGKAQKKRVQSADSNEVDAVALKAILANIGYTNIDAVIFEACPDHAGMASTMKSMAGNAGKIMAVLELCGLEGSTHRIISSTWQPDMLGKVPKKETKVFAEMAARRLWPEQDWRKSERCTVPHSGFIDAALIAEWGRIRRAAGKL